MVGLKAKQHIWGAIRPGNVSLGSGSSASGSGNSVSISVGSGDGSGGTFIVITAGDPSSNNRGAASVIVGSPSTIRGRRLALASSDGCTKGGSVTIDGGDDDKRRRKFCCVWRFDPEHCNCERRHEWC